MASFDKTSMEGYLEKHNPVSRFLGKSRFWCTLQGSCLVYCKESKRSSVVESLLLGDAQMVRKTSSDRQGTQFEIVMKKQKTHVFTAASVSECTDWVKHLQHAMTIRHEPTSCRSEFRRQIVSDSGYEEITIDPDSTPSVGGACFRKPISVPQSGIYAEVVDAVRPKSEGVQWRAVSDSSAGEYAEVADVVGARTADDTPETSDRAESVVYRENSLYIRSSDREELAKDLQQENTGTQDMANGYSTLDSCKDMAMKAEAEDKARNDKEEEKDEQPGTVPEYAIVKKKKTKDTSERKSSFQEEKMPDIEANGVYENYEGEVREGAAIEKLDYELKRLPESSAASVWISVTADDRKPVEDLKEFLANNRQLCRPSYTRLVGDHDPLVRMKELIQEIG